MSGLGSPGSSVLGTFVKADFEFHRPASQPGPTSITVLPKDVIQRLSKRVAPTPRVWRDFFQSGTRESVVGH